MDEEVERRLINLETIVSCQDQMLEDMNSVIVEQGKTVDKLRVELAELKQVLRSRRKKDEAAALFE